MSTKKSASPGAVLTHVLGTLILVLAIVLCLFPALPRLFGLSGYTILSGSMEPTIPVGSLVYSRPVDNPETLAAGDIVLFYEGLGTTPVVHRILENRLTERELITKGDANSAEDLLPVPYANILGKDVLHLPMLGTLLYPLTSFAGKLSVLSMLGGGLLLRLVSRRLRAIE